MMRKVLFLMIMLFLMGLGTASVKAQVRIGSNTPPNASAVLDLNANDTNSGTLGLALPRVALTSNTMLLSGVTSNLTGMMVYNTSTTGTGVNAIGIYYWNGATWVSASLPSTSAADSGELLISNGLTWVPGYPTLNLSRIGMDTIIAHLDGIGFPLTKILDTTVTLPITLTPYSGISYRAIGLNRTDWCQSTPGATGPAPAYTTAIATNGYVALYNNMTGIRADAGMSVRIFCFRLAP